MSSAKTTADLFRERGWGVGTKVQLDGDAGGPLEVTCVGRQIAAAIGSDGFESIWRTTTDGWSLYTPTPPIPTREEWVELWAKLKAWIEKRQWAEQCSLSTSVYATEEHDAYLVLAALVAKAGDA
jgi:hypothetical protein